MQPSNDLRFPFRGNSSEALLKLPPRAAAVIKSKLCQRPSRSAALKGESGTPASRQERFPRFHQPHSAEKQWSRYCGSGPPSSNAKLRLPQRAAAPRRRIGASNVSAQGQSQYCRPSRCDKQSRDIRFQFRYNSMHWQLKPTVASRSAIPAMRTLRRATRVRMQ